MVIKYQDDAVAEGRTPLRVFVGRIVHSRSPGFLELLSQGALGVYRDGAIAFLMRLGGPFEPMHPEMGEFCNAKVIYLERSQFLMPGMVDTHLHAPQWPNLGLGMDGQLKEWVEKWTNPMEVRFSHVGAFLLD